MAPGILSYLTMFCPYCDSPVGADHFCPASSRFGRGRGLPPVPTATVEEDRPRIVAPPRDPAVVALERDAERAGFAPDARKTLLCLLCRVGKIETPLRASLEQFLGPLTPRDKKMVSLAEDDPDLKTPQTHPQHGTVGHHFGGYHWSTDKAEAGTRIYFCDSYDSRKGFWLTNVNDPFERKNVSERAIGGTYHEAYPNEAKDGWWISQWSTRQSFADLAALAERFPAQRFS